MGRTDSMSVRVDAPVGRVWELIADPTRMPEWSPTVQRCEWAPGSDGLAPGARFVGHNRRGAFRWSRQCIVEAVSAGAELTFTTLVGGKPSVRWRYTLERDGDTTVITESYEVLSEPAYIRAAQPLLGGKLSRDARKGMEQTLNRIKHAAEQQ